MHLCSRFYAVNFDNSSDGGGGQSVCDFTIPRYSAVIIHKTETTNHIKVN